MLDIKSNADVVARGLDKLSEQLKNIRQVADPKLEKEFKRQTKRIFNTRGKSGESGKWAKLKEPYRSWKAKKYPGRNILIRSGDMKRDLLSSDAFSSFNVSGEIRFRWDTNIEYWEYHQFGTDNMVARKTIDQTFENNMEFLSIISDSTQKIVKGQKVFDHVVLSPPKKFDKVD